MRRFLFVVSWLLVSLPQVQAQALPCKPLLGSEYEKIYCELQRRGKGHTLPKLYEFRRNPPLTQAFLLKKPAERAGIKLVIPSRDNRETLRRQKELLLGSKKIEQVAAVAVEKQEKKQVSKKIPRIQEQAAIILKINQSVLNSCKNKALNVYCADGDYDFLGNIANSQLAADALQNSNMLNLPVFDENNARGLDDYLALSYSAYIRGMITIGLGASTMTYSKFAHLYGIMRQQGQNFPERFELMFTFLKRDKTTIAVSTQREIPDDFVLDYCHFLDGKLLACEHKKTNYLFVRSF